jgi:hypothetical protein
MQAESRGQYRHHDLVRQAARRAGPHGDQQRPTARTVSAPADVIPADTGTDRTPTFTPRRLPLNTPSCDGLYPSGSTEADRRADAYRDRPFFRKIPGDGRIDAV